jgi:hypothetical protein
MDPTDRWTAAGGRYDRREVMVPRGTSPAEARRSLTDAAEYGRWELKRSQVYWGGARRVWLQRKVLTVESTL